MSPDLNPDLTRLGELALESSVETYGEGGDGINIEIDSTAVASPASGQNSSPTTGTSSNSYMDGVFNITTHKLVPWAASPDSYAGASLGSVTGRDLKSPASPL